MTPQNMINPPSAFPPNWGISAVSASPRKMAALCPWWSELPFSLCSWTPPCPPQDVDTKSISLQASYEEQKYLLASTTSSLSKICNSLQPCFLHKDNLLLTPVVSSEGSLTGSEHDLVKILPKPHCVQLDFRNWKWVISSYIDANPANLSQTLLVQLPN